MKVRSIFSLLIHSSPKPEPYRIVSYLVYLSTSGGKWDVYSILLETLLGNIMNTIIGSLVPLEKPV